MFLYQVVDTLNDGGVKYTLVGGYALALHGIVRATMDVDLVLNLKLADFEQAEKCFGKIGLKSRLPIRAQDVINMRKEYIENRNLIAWSFVDFKDPTRVVDILITKDLKDLETQTISVGGRKIRVATLSELAKMKSESGRPQDLVDLQKIKEALNEKKK